MISRQQQRILKTFQVNWWWLRGFLPVIAAGLLLYFFPYFRQNLFDTFTYNSAAFNQSFSTNNPNSLQQTALKAKQTAGELAVGSTKITVELARSPEEQRIGLSKYKSLPEKSGMLFVFEVPAKQNFWAKGMQFAFDIIWIADSQVVGFTENIQAPAPNTSDAELKNYEAPVPITAALEVNAGFVARNKIKIGNPVSLTFSNISN